MKHLIIFTLILLCGGVVAQTAAPASETGARPEVSKKYYPSGQVFMMISSVNGEETERVYFLDSAPANSAAYAVKVNCTRDIEEQAMQSRNGYMHSIGRNGNGNGHRYTRPSREIDWDTSAPGHAANQREWLNGYPARD